MRALDSTRNQKLADSENPWKPQQDPISNAIPHEPPVRTYPLYILWYDILRAYVSNSTSWATLGRFQLTILRVCRYVMSTRLVHDAYKSIVKSYLPKTNRLGAQEPHVLLVLIATANWEEHMRG